MQASNTQPSVSSIKIPARSVGMFWMVWGLPLSAILISGSMSIIAVKYQDPLLPTYNQQSADDAESGSEKAARSTSMISAEQARNHAANLVDAPDYKGLSVKH